MSTPDGVLLMKLRSEAKLPGHSHPGDGGWDLFSAINVTIEPGERQAIPTGIAIAMPAGMVGLVHARSGRALKEGLALVNAPGVVDAAYRGELQVIAINLDSRRAIDIAVGDRIAQLLFAYVPHITFHEVAELPGTHRGDGGFGSSGQ
jgi:dUTP pyrophosphatase